MKIKKRLREAWEQMNEEYDFGEEFVGDSNVWVDKEIYYYVDIDMNPYSLSFFKKSLFCSNPSAIFLSSVINFFQSMTISKENEIVRYGAYTHALVFYYLRMLDKHGIIKIIEHRKADETEILEPYYQVLGNVPRKTEIKMYDILFYKVRDLNEDDLPLLRKMMKTFHINDYEIVFEMGDEGLSTRLSRRSAVQAVLSGHFFKQMWKSWDFYRRDEVFKGDVRYAKTLVKRKDDDFLE